MNDKKILSTFLLIIIISIILPSEFLCQNTQNNLTTLELFNEYLIKYTITNNNFSEMIEKFESVQFNFILKLEYSRLKTLNETILTQITSIKNNLDNDNNNNYKKNKFSTDIKLLSGDIEKYDRNSNKVVEMYYKYETTKDIIIEFIKIFSITVSIVMVLSIICIILITIFIVKKQRKYYVLNEEVTLEKDGKREKKDSSEASSTREDLRKKIKFKISNKLNNDVKINNNK